jgi:hypothetical protein
VVFAIMLLLFGVPWWTLLSAGTHWPPVVVILGTAGFAVAFIALPVTMAWGMAAGIGPGRGDR